jgi:RNase H-fold protein (predicted Holliday junction resolvase)
VPNPGRLLMSSQSSFNFNNTSTQTFCTKIKPAASTDSEEKLSKRDKKEKEMIDESTTSHKALQVYQAVPNVRRQKKVILSCDG